MTSAVEDQRAFIEELECAREAVQNKLTNLIERRTETADLLKRMVTGLEKRGFERAELASTARARAMTNEIGELDAEIARAKDVLAGIDEHLDKRRGDAERSGADSPDLQRIKASPERARVSVSEPVTYQRGDRRHSYLQDLIRNQLNLDPTGEARDRLMRHAQDVATLPGYAEARDLSRTDGSGGYFAPPAWLVDQFIKVARPGRPFADAVQKQQLPPGTDSINIPKVMTGTATGIQTADNTSVVEQDLTDSFVNAPVRTIAGQQGISLQLLDQSPVAFDEIVFQDLVADYAVQVDKQVLYGSGTTGQVLGVHNTNGIQTIPVSSVDIQGVYSAIAQAITLVNTSRYLPPDAIFMHPRRFGWFTAQLDSEHRPLFLPDAQSPMNAVGIQDRVAAESVVGRMQGIPIVADNSIGTTFGSETPTGTEDAIYVVRSTDLVLYESGLRTRVLPEVRADTLTILVQAYGYLAFASRYPSSVVEISGLTAPVW